MTVSLSSVQLMQLGLEAAALGTMYLTEQAGNGSPSTTTASGSPSPYTLAWGRAIAASL